MRRRPLDDSNPYDAPATVGSEPAPDSIPSTPVRATIAAVLAPVALGGFVLNDPWMIRDGIWMQHLVNAFPWYVGTIGLSFYALLVPNRSRAAMWISIVTLIVFACLPLTWRYTERVFTQMMPFS